MCKNGRNQCSAIVAAIKDGEKPEVVARLIKRRKR